MTDKNGYWGNVLEADLSQKTINNLSFPDELFPKLIGGRGLLHWLHYFNVEPNVDPLGPDNKLIFATGAFTGTLAPSASRYVVGAKSPLTGFLGDSNSGGQFGPEIKFAGYDAIMLKNSSSEPVYMTIFDDEVEFHSASDLWGKDTEGTEEFMYDKYGEDIQVACIGIGGENLVKFSGIVCNKDHIAARTGMGAVMGSKKLKAMVIRGTKDLPINNDIDKFMEARNELWDIVINDDRSGGELPDKGTTSLYEHHNELGGLSTRNWQSGSYEDIDVVNSDVLKEEYTTNTTACFSCPSHCDRYTYVSEGEFAGTYVGGPEYYTMLSFGSKLDNNNLPSILKANQLCNKFGLDTGSTGGVIAFAIECYEKGLLTKDMTDGLELKWGNYKAILKLIKKIANREGFGNILAQGFDKSIDYIGEESRKYSVDIKGMDPPTLDPRALKVYNFRYAIASRGGDHLRISANGAYGLDELPIDEAAEKLRFWQGIVTTSDMIGVCKFPYSFYSETPEVTFHKMLDLVPEMLTGITGEEFDEDRVLKTAERVDTIERSLNIRYGLTPADDDLPDRFKEEPLPSGPNEGEVYDIFDDLKKHYYDVAGWDMKSGIPFSEKYEELGLEKIKQDLEERGYEISERRD